MDFVIICKGLWVVCAVINIFLGLIAMKGVASIDGKVGCMNYIEWFLTIVFGPLGTLYYIAGIIHAERSVIEPPKNNRR